MGVLLSLHLLAATIWVGGMFFAYLCLRPVAAVGLEPPARLLLWRGVFGKFFRWVWLSVLVLLLTGHGMIAVIGGMAVVGMYVHLMLALGYLMVILYGVLFFRPYQLLKGFVDTQQWPAAAVQLNRIRQIVLVNLCLGLLVLVIASGGRYLF